MIFGEKLDIHAGGIDLQFPHHENEIVQCHAYHQTNNWCNYFLHTGHVNIAGEKMSKSLKNFITIQDLLGKYSANQIRMFCIMTKYSKPIDFSEEAFQNAVSLDRKLQTFLIFLKERLKSNEFLQESNEFLKEERDLKSKDTSKCNHYQFVSSTFDEIENRYQNDFDTPGVVRILIELMTYTFANQNEMSWFTFKLISENLIKHLEMLGFKYFNLDYSNLVQDTLNFRGLVRSALKSNKTKGEMFKICDEFRKDLENKHSIIVQDK
jgi:cysteinyl-tRNA synthetase